VASVDVVSEVTGTVWRITAQVGQSLAPDDEVLVIESMKMEIPVCATEGGALRELLVAEGDMVQEGAVVARLQGDDS
jgi:acetyl-CoA carboxylase biotin carboxyl carrier protein